MKKILYITANSKPEEVSSCRTVGRSLVNAIYKKFPEARLEEVDLYKEHIPQLKGCYFSGRSSLVSGADKSKLTYEEQKEIDQVIKLCDQFAEADIYVLAAPMWSLSFPAPLKEYIDCIVQSGKTIEFEDNKPHGILDDKNRVFIYVQTSGGKMPRLIRPALNKGLNYVHDIMKFIGIAAFEELLVDGTGTTESERQEAMKNAMDKIDSLIKKLL